MPGPDPQIIERRALRNAERRRRQQRTLVTVGVVVGLTVALCAVAAWAVVSSRRDAPETTRAATTLLAGAGATASGDSTPTGSAASTGGATPGSATVTSATAAAPESGPETVTVAAVGDMIFDRRVKTLIASGGGKAPLSRVARLLRRADITIGNLESPLSDGGTRNAKKDVTFRGDPRAISGLSASGFDLLSIANNHVLDYGPDALADTCAALDDAGIAHAGAGKNQAAAWKPAVVRTGDTSTAYLAYSFIVPAGFVAQSNRAGLASGRWDFSAVEKAIAKAKRANDYVVVSIHWGVEYKDNANAEQVRVARRCIDAGADMVLAHHPHVIQGIEIYKKRLIAYSLGDFVFDHYSRKTGESFILTASLTPKGVTAIKITPTYLDTYGRPAVVKGAAADAILSRLKRISAVHGTSVVIKGDTASVKR